MPHNTEVMSEFEKKCPFCRAEGLTPTGQMYDLGEILTRWEAENSIAFSDEVWEQYAVPGSRHVILQQCTRCCVRIFTPVKPGSLQFYSDIVAGNTNYYTYDKWEFGQAIKDIRGQRCRRVLDVGAGSGYFLDKLAVELPSIERWGYEFNSDAASAASSRGHSICWGDFPSSVREASGGGDFDAVCAFQVLEHVGDPADFITKMRSLLSIGGVLILAVPDDAGPVRYFPNALTNLPPHHVSRWYGSTFEVGLPLLGFTVSRITYEPLPDYLWNDYLPVMLNRSWLPGRITPLLIKNQRLIRLLRWMKVRVLYGVPGHSIYVLARRTS